MLVERTQFLASLAELLTEAAAGSGRLVFLGGEAGVGKTSLASALAAGAPDETTVRRGGCDNLATAAALGPFHDAMPEIADVLADEAAISRLRLFRQIRELLSETPTLLLLEDVHWADEATLELLRFLGRRIDGVPLMIVASYRADEVGPNHPLTVVLGDLATVPGVARMRLPALTVDGVRQLVESAGSPVDPAQLHRSTSGNPFYVTEVLASGAEALPATVRDAVLARVSRLSVSGQGVLAAVAVLGNRVEVDLAVAVSGESIGAVDECLQHGVLVADGAALGFRHEIARLAVERTQSHGALIDLHARALAELQRRGSRDERRLAYHAAGCSDRAAVRLHAPRAAARAARLGAHREAAEQYRLALQWTDDRDDQRAQLLERRSYECYLIGEHEQALACRHEALELYEQGGNALAIGAAQRSLSRLSWFLGRNDDAERYAVSAVATLEPLGDTRELAMAYSNMAHLRMLHNDVDGTLRWGQPAIELARRVGDREVEMHALNNVGTVQAVSGEIAAGFARLEQSLDLALADDAHEHAARAYTNLGNSNATNRNCVEAERQLRAGIAYCTERDLDAWRLYMSAWLAIALTEQGQLGKAQRYAADVLRHPDLPSVTEIHALVVAAQIAARRGEDVTERLDRALMLATPTGEAQRVVPASVARAEVAWLAGRTSDIAGEIDRAWPLAVAYPHPWEIGELIWWLRVAGEPRQSPIAVAAPFALMLAGRHRDAAQEWQTRGCPLWAAHALCASDDVQDARDGIEILDALDVPAVKQAILRDRHARGQPVPRGPRATSRANPDGLTTREIEILGLLAEGLSNADVAGRLFLSEKTVGHHVSSVLRKLGEPSRARAVATALRRGIVRPK